MVDLKAKKKNQIIEVILIINIREQQSTQKKKLEKNFLLFLIVGGCNWMSSAAGVGNDFVYSYIRIGRSNKTVI